MACLDVETPSICREEFRSVLRMCLQQRRSRKQLLEEDIMPPLKTPTVLHERIRSLETNGSGNFSKHKLCSRPTHVLPETQPEPSVQAEAMKQKRPRLAEELREPIAPQTGPPEQEEEEESVPSSDSGVKEVTDGDRTSRPDVYSFDEDTSNSPSPEAPSSRDSPIARSASPKECEGTNSDLSLSAQLSPPMSDVLSTDEQPSSKPATPTRTVLVKRTLPNVLQDKVRGEKSRKTKPRTIKNFKYHQYIPPDQKRPAVSEPGEAPTDPVYALVLQQQNRFLQLQILSNQQWHTRATNEVHACCCSAALTGIVHPNSKRLPANLDEMKVPELKMELKVRSLPVSGTKIDLIERLKLYHERSSFKNAVAVETVAENAKLTPPLSPVASKASAVCAGDTGGLSPAGAVSSPQSARLVEKPPETGPCEKDRCLYAKEKQIEELKRKLEQEQRLVKELKLQLEVEKRSQLGEAPRPTAAVKQEEAEEHGRRAPEFVVHSGVRSVQTSGHLPPKTAKLQQQRQRPLRKKWGMDSSGPNLPNTAVTPQLTGASPGHAAHRGPRVSKYRNPPCYEDAVKQTRMSTAVEGVSAASQQMDDLFDVLIESGEITPFIKQEPPGLNEAVTPVTPSITTLPINTVLSRPPPLVHVAPAPAAVLRPSSGLTALHSDPQLEPLLESSVSHDAETQTLMEELHPANMGVDFTDNMQTPTLKLHSMDNMDWLDLDLSAAPVGDLSSPLAFLDSQELL